VERSCLNLPVIDLLSGCKNLLIAYLTRGNFGFAPCLRRYHEHG
jgi:hypothetical protein